MAEVTKKKRTCALRSAPEEERKGDGTSAEQEPEAGPAPEGDVPPRAGRKGRGSRKERAEPDGTPRQATGRAPRCVKKAGALAGADSFVCILFGLSSGSLTVWLTFRMNRKFGENGLMKRLAEKRHPRYLIHRRRLFRLLTKRKER